VPVDVRLCPGEFALRLGAVQTSHIGGHTFLNVIDRPLRDWRWIAKSIEDRILSSLILAMISPVMLAIALLIRLDSRGPALFRQKRYGFNNELIEVLKFRSMYIDQTDANASKLVTKGDPRVTRVGRLIRKTSLDELPQLINVLKGELSLVGPRPHALQAKAADRLYHEVVDGYFARHRVKPGITGWAQINGWRGETDTSEKIQRRVEHDLYYIDNWSVFLDLYILLKTPFALLRGDNAY
jgi:exopolysaccharide biosynthesis polyprenyl glycosylphosphotransferase